MTEAIAPDTPEERRRAWLWPVIIIGMLGVHTLGCLIVVFIATTDPSHAVVSDYHAKAVAWDDLQAQARASLALGWTCTISTSAMPDMLGQRSVRVSLRDADGVPVTDAVVSLSAFHHARGNDVSRAELSEGAPGEYVAMMDMRRQGLWGFDITAVKGDDIYTAQLDQRVGSTPPKPEAPPTPQ